MKIELLLKILLLIIIVQCCSSSMFEKVTNMKLKVDNILCANHIETYVEALAAEKTWAKDSKIIFTYFKMKLHKYLQCLNRPQTSRNNSSLVIPGILVTLINA